MGNRSSGCLHACDVQRYPSSHTEEIANQLQLFRGETQRITSGKTLNSLLLETEEYRDLFLRLSEKLEENDECLSNCFDSDSEGRNNLVDELPDAGPGSATEPLEGWELFQVWEDLTCLRTPSQGVAVRLIREVTQLHDQLPNVVPLARPPADSQIIVVGDLHGHLGDLLHLVNEVGEPKDGPGGIQYIFNGDFVDRGWWGPEVLLALYCLKLRFPALVHLNRGNHEDILQNGVATNGFRDRHCLRLWEGNSEVMYSVCLASFLVLPLCHTIGDEIIVLHGGLPLDPHLKLSDIQAINRKQNVPTEQCCILGYKRNQPVMAKQNLRDESKRLVLKGTRGHLARRVPKTPYAMVAFDNFKEPFRVLIAGSPELEQDVDIIYTLAEAQQARCDRLFVALLWSDPIRTGDNSAAGPNHIRGTGTLFTDKVTEAFLKANKLRCLLRSHQKQPDGYLAEQYASDGEQVILGTVFTASNYPQGAGEPGGNKANVVSVTAAPESKSMGVRDVGAWSESYLVMDKWTKGRNSAHPGLTEARLEELNQRSDDSFQQMQSRVLEQLWLQIYTARPQLLKYFQSLDTKEAGTVTRDQWATAMRACVVPDKKFPWEESAKFLATFDDHDLCHYGAFLARYKNTLSFQLEEHWCSRMLELLFRDMEGEDQLGAEWEKLDTDKTDTLSYRELRVLLKGQLGTDACTDGDLVYALCAKLDRDHSGFVDRSEFFNAVKDSHEAKSSKVAFTADDDRAIRECWQALHTALRLLSGSSSRVTTMFLALDANKDGGITRGEFKSGLMKFTGELAATVDHWEPLLWRLVDKDRSGCVTLQELSAALAVRDTKRYAQPVPE